VSLSAALSTASSSLDLFSLGIQIAGHNIANASTPGYVRDELTTETSLPYRRGSVVIGTGATATGVRQQLDEYLEQRIRTANTDASASNVRNQAYQQLQSALQELGDQDLSSSLNSFLTSIQNVVNQPDDPAQRTQLIQQGGQLASDARGLRLRLDELQNAYSGTVQSLVGEANALIKSIAELNPEITRLESNGLEHSDAGALRVQRLNALQRLAEIIPISVQELPSGAVDVHTGNDYLILSGHYQQIETILQPSDTGSPSVTVQLTQTHSLVGPGGGEIGGLIESRDRIVGGFVQQLDQLIGGVINEVNKIHSSGEGLRGYSSVTGTYSVDDTTAPLNAAGLTFTPQHGSFQLKVRNVSTGAVTTTDVPIDLDGIGTDTSLEDLRAALGAIGHVTAGITADNKLKLTADDGYELRFGNDTSGVLAALGINTFFAGNDSGDIAVQDNLLQDQRYLATGRGGGPADNSNVVELASFLDNPVVSLGDMSLDDFQTTLVGTVAQSASAEDALAKGFESFRDSLKTQREQRSGVNLDEEAIHVLQLQHNYQAAARIISTVEQLLNVLLNV